MKIGILLSGCGVYDGAEIQEAVFSMLAVEEAGAEYQCISLNKNQHHVINHLTGDEMNESRNMMVEAARIARGNVIDVSEVSPAILDGLIIPGGFGSAKNFSKWAFDGADGEISPEIKLLLVNFVNAGKPIAALCVSPILVAKALEGSAIKTELTMGNTTDKSPYTIADFNNGIEQTGAKIKEKALNEVFVDVENKIITAPCYMMDAKISEIKSNIDKSVKALINLVE
jgi:enhancing lycopene biosynthesis protein 2